MRRFLLIACAIVALLALSATALAGKPATYKAGVYNGKVSNEAFSVSVKKGSCKAAAGQKKSSLKLCVSLSKPPEFECQTPTPLNTKITSFATSVQLPASGKFSQKAPFSIEGLPGGAPWTGEATFSLALKKNGTATGTFGLSVNESFGTSSAVCTGTEPFTAKLH